ARRGARTRRLTQPVRRRPAARAGRTVALAFAAAACLALVAGTCLLIALTRQGEKDRQTEESRPARQPVAKRPEPKRGEVKPARALPAAAERPAVPPPAPKVSRQSGGRPLVPSRLYDGTGRYTMAKDDGAKGTQGLTELARR